MPIEKTKHEPFVVELKHVSVRVPAVCRWTCLYVCGVCPSVHTYELEKKMSKLINTPTTVVYNVRNDANEILPNYFIVKNVETKEYFVSNAYVADVKELDKTNTVAPMTKNYADASDMVKELSADPTLTHITPKGLTAIRSARGKRAWAKKKALANA